jgi:hypothetical protein
MEGDTMMSFFENLSTRDVALTWNAFLESTKQNKNELKITVQNKRKQGPNNKVTIKCPD